VEIAIISDTHMPRGGRRLPEACVARLRAADLILHAGDLMRLSVLRDLQALGPPVFAVQGNVDDADVRAALPMTQLVRAGAVWLGMIHDAGPVAGRLARMRGRFPEAQAAVFGHSHIPLHERAADGFQIFNPGSPTERRRSPAHTMGVAQVRGDTVEFELITLA
jgi:putative phosphoesterase